MAKLSHLRHALFWGISLLYDVLVLAGLLMTYTFAVVAGNHGEAIQPGNVFYQSSLVLLILGYYCGSWRWGGQTIGQRAVGIKISNLDGEAPGWKECLRRCGLRLPALILSPVTYLVGKHSLSQRWTKTQYRLKRTD